MLNPLLTKEALMSVIDDYAAANAAWEGAENLDAATQHLEHARQVVEDRVNLIIHHLNGGV